MQDKEQLEKEVLAHVKELAAESEPHTVHCHLVGFRKVSINIFYETDAILEERKENSDLVPRISESVKTKYPDLAQAWVSTILDSVENVERMGGWISYYK